MNGTGEARTGDVRVGDGAPRTGERLRSGVAGRGVGDAGCGGETCCGMGETRCGVGDARCGGGDDTCGGGVARSAFSASPVRLGSCTARRSPSAWTYTSVMTSGIACGNSLLIAFVFLAHNRHRCTHTLDFWALSTSFIAERERLGLYMMSASVTYFFPFFALSTRLSAGREIVFSFFSDGCVVSR